MATGMDQPFRLLSKSTEGHKLWLTITLYKRCATVYSLFVCMQVYTKTKMVGLSHNSQDSQYIYK